MTRSALLHGKKVFSWTGMGALVGAAFIGTAMLGGIFGLAVLHLLACGALFLILWDARLPVSEKAIFVCGDCRYHWSLDENSAICTRTEQPTFTLNPACRDMRVKRPAA